MIVAASHESSTVLLVIGVVGLIFGAVVYLAPGALDAVTRMRLRMEGERDDDQAALERDRSRRRLIALILAIGSAAILAQGLSRL
jgi:hypothetical protein